MRRPAAARRDMACITLCVALASCRSGDLRDWLIDPDAVAADTAASTHILEYVGSLGLGALPDGFTYDGSVAGHAAGWVAIESSRDCMIAVLDRRTGQPLRQFGRCGDGPHDIHSGTTGAMWVGDTLATNLALLSRILLWGDADTVVRTIRLARDTLVGVTNPNWLAVVDETTAVASLGRTAMPDSIRNRAAGPLVEFDLRSGTPRRTYLHEVFRLDHLSDPARRPTRFCVAPDGETVVVDNGGAPEILGMTRTGTPRIAWSRTFATDGIRHVAWDYAAPPGMHWRRVAVGLGCDATAAVVRLLVSPNVGEVFDSSASPGRLVALAYDGRVLLNEVLTPEDLPLVHTRWYADDSLHYVTTPRSMSPQILVFRLTARARDDLGAFRIPHEKRRELVEGIP